MIYISPIVKLLTSAVTYKNGALVATSFLMSFTGHILELEIFGKPMGLLVLTSFLFVCDFFSGVVASRHEASLAENERELARKKFKSSKITFTFLKFVMLFLWIWLEESVSDRIKHIEILNSSYELVRSIPIILIALREYVSIGENIERKYNMKPYMFSLADKIFEILELKFLNKLGVKKNNQDED